MLGMLGMHWVIDVVDACMMLRDACLMCVCLLLVRARAKRKGIKYGATRSAGDYLDYLVLTFCINSTRAGACKSAESRRVGVLVIPSGAVLVGRGPPLQPKGAGLSGATRQRVGFPLKILDETLSSSLISRPLCITAQITGCSLPELCPRTPTDSWTISLSYMK